MADEQFGATSRIVTLDHNSPTPLFRQLYDCLREGILAGQLRPGAQLPSTRLLALDLGVSRVTVQNAYEQLIAEGYATGRHGSGTYVSPTLPASHVQTAFRTPTRLKKKSTTRALSQRASELMSIPSLESAIPCKAPGASYAFQPGLPALDAFPWQLWGRLVGRCWRQASGSLLVDQSHGGYYPLREAIAHHLMAERGLTCEVDQVIITTGTQQAIDLAARLLLDPGDKAWIEDPGSPGAYSALAAAGAQICPVPVDDEGINVASGVLHHPEARFAFVTPAHQSPTGVTMSLNRRLALLNWAYQTGAWIFEDDCGGEYRYDGRPVAPLQALDRQQRVLYAGSFGKLLFPALRLGYLVAPPDLVEPLQQLQRFTAQPPLLEQTVLAEFMAHGHFAHHLRATRSLYHERQQELLAQLTYHLKGVTAHPVETGIDLLAWLPNEVNDRTVATRARQRDILTQPLSAHRFATSGPGALVLGFAAADHKSIVQGVRQLALALHN